MAATNLILVLQFSEFHSCILNPRLVCYRGFLSVWICIINFLLGLNLLVRQFSGLFLLLLIGLLLSFRNLFCMSQFIFGHCFPMRLFVFLVTLWILYNSFVVFHLILYNFGCWFGIFTILFLILQLLLFGLLCPCFIPHLDLFFL